MLLKELTSLFLKTDSIVTNPNKAAEVEHQLAGTLGRVINGLAGKCIHAAQPWLLQP